MDLTSTTTHQHDLEHVRTTLVEACDRVAPLWPLESFVAVNPYLGLIDRSFHAAAHTLSKASGVRTTMPTAYYCAAYDHGVIGDADLAVALARRGHDPGDTGTFMATARSASAAEAPHLQVPSEIASVATGRAWDRLRTDRVSSWAAAHYDRGQALWPSADPETGVFASWKRDAALDRTPDIMGLKGFRTTIRSLPDDPTAAASLVLDELAVPAHARRPFVHALLMRMGGWASFTSRVAWDARLAGGDDDSPLQFAAVLLCWELGIWRATNDPAIAAAWERNLAGLAVADDPADGDAALDVRLVLQDAFDHAAQDGLVRALSESGTRGPSTTGSRPAVQTVMCIDVRSEVFRRNLESTAEGVETLGFAGFFGLPLGYLPLAHETPVAQCPVLLTPSHVVGEVLPDAAATAEAVSARRLDHHVRRAWKSFKMGAVSCFSFVGPVGLAYLPKLLTDGAGVTRPVRPPETEGLAAEVVAAAGPSVAPVPGPSASLATGIEPAARLDMAEGALRGMSLVDGFAPLVLLTGHGSSTVNNPYGTGLDCGACGGHTGEVSARIAATLLNDDDVRSGLRQRGIDIPDDTWFVAALHDTTTDDVSLFDTSSVPSTHAEALSEVAGWLAEAGRRARRERAARLGLSDATDTDKAVRGRSTDWAQVRPEWGLAGCRAFLAAPRDASRGIDLEGRVFLHSYDRSTDPEFSVLEVIMTAPMIVASWISLQYFASTVDNEAFGSGNKTLHNVVGRMGVLEGNGGDLRSGLPWQSVHDGARLQHEPLRLQVVIAAPTEAMSAVIARHEMVRQLCDNGWLALYACDDDGTVTHRYAGDLRWDAVTPPAAPSTPKEGNR